MHVSGLFIYPVKSLGGFSRDSSAVDELGFEGDRRFLLIDGEGKFMTQRNHPRMALIKTGLTRNALLLNAPGQSGLSVSRVADEPCVRTHRVAVWSSEGLVAEDCGQPAAQWLGDFLKTSCRLVRIGPLFERPILERKLPQGGPGLPPIPHRIAFSDALPFMVISEASLADLNDRLAERQEEEVPMNRFRPSFVIAGAAPYEEDTWQRFRIGEVVFQSCGPCARCLVPTTDQDTAERGHEPLRTLADYRRDPAKPANVNFGQNLVHENKTGMLRVGDPVEILP